jgi:four helix bundle protein
MNCTKRFGELDIWKESGALSRAVYHFFKTKFHGYDRPLCTQIIRSSGSVADNIAEGFERGGNKAFLQYLWISKASAGECKYQLYRTLNQDFICEEDFDNLKRRIEMLSVKIFRFINYLKGSELKGQKMKTMISIQSLNPLNPLNL